MVKALITRINGIFFEYYLKTYNNMVEIFYTHSLDKHPNSINKLEIKSKRK